VNRRGTTLVELLLTVSMLASFGICVTAVVRGAIRVTVRALTALGSERTLLSTAVLLRYELQDGAWSRVAVVSDSIRLDRRVGEGPLCGAPAGDLLVGRQDWSGARAPQAGRDQIYGLRPGAGWYAAGITAVQAGNCPDGTPALRLTLSGPIDSLVWLRVVEATVLRRYRSGHADWLGLAPADGTVPVQPFAGPLQPGGSRFRRDTGLLRLSLDIPSGVREVVLPLDTLP
jgi:hypothetical protein